MRVSVEGGKYTYVNELGKAPCVLRYEEPWRDATGDKFIYCMASEIESLREQVEKLMKEGIEYREKWLSEQSRNLSEEAEFEILSQQVVALEYLSVVDTAAIENLHEQLATLAEQNEKLRKVLLRLACLGNGDQYGNSIGNCIAQEALSLPDLASPVLNRIRAEGMRMAAEILIDPMDRAAAQKIRAQADELEKQNG